MQAIATHRWNGLGPLGTSAVLHLMVILAVIFLHFTPLKHVAPESTISVELLPSDTFENKKPNEPSDLPRQNASTANIEIPAAKDNGEKQFLDAEPKLPATPQTTSTKSQTRAFIRAHHFYASEILKNPKSKGTASDLRQLSPEERMIQLCNLEAMEQVSRWKTRIKADFLVSYAMADTRRTGQKITADGAAVRSKGHWFNLKYSCDVTADMEAVDAFEFVLGDEIPEVEWAAHSLPSGENFDD